MTTRFKKLLEKDQFLAVGLMSGTSMDAIDAALVRLPASASPDVEFIGFCATPYPEELRSTLRSFAFGEPFSAADMATLHTGVAVAFAAGFQKLCDETKIVASDVDFIGSHGQTVAHVPPNQDGLSLIAGTLQLGPPGMIAALTGVTTIGDFRVADMALGGQGAPLAPFVDMLLRGSRTKTRVILNIGGIANVTLLPKTGVVEDVIAFDTGPGNMIVDELHRVLYEGQDEPSKLNERIANGTPSLPLAEKFLTFGYFDQKPPKSAGHHEFGGPFAWEFLQKAKAAGMKRDDILATAIVLTTESIRHAFEKFIRPQGDVDEIYVTGGGSHNTLMMKELERSFPRAEVMPIDKLGVSAEAKEAVDFAVLGREALMGRHNVIRQVTGAGKTWVLGAIAWGGAL